MTGTSPAMLAREACHGESKTQGEGYQGKIRKEQEEGRGEIRKALDVCEKGQTAQAAALHRQPSS